MVSDEINSVKGRFAPSPTGRMHLGNVFTAVISWLDVKTRGGKWVLRIEDLDPQRSKECWSRLIEDDLHWLGLEWDEGGTADKGPCGPYRQSVRGEIYEKYLDKLNASGLTYPCTCRRADLLATNAPHQSDGRVIYGGRCRPASFPCRVKCGEKHSVRLFVPDETIAVEDDLFGLSPFNLATDCGDFIVRRADGAWAYQLAVVVDDALMGVNRVVRGCDLLLSAAQQMYLCRLLGFTPPAYLHLPLVCNAAGQRLSKRDRSLSMEVLRERFSPRELLGIVASLAGFIPESRPVTITELQSLYNPALIPACESIILENDLV